MTCTRRESAIGRPRLRTQRIQDCQTLVEDGDEHIQPDVDGTEYDVRGAGVIDGGGNLKLTLAVGGAGPLHQRLNT